MAGLFALLLALTTLRPLGVPDEARYVGIGLWMLQSGDWLTPHLNGIPFFHKPPYLYWLEAMSLAIFGVHAWALRLVPALHAGHQSGPPHRRAVAEPRHAGRSLDQRGDLVLCLCFHAPSCRAAWADT